MKLKINNVPGYNGTIDIKTDSDGTPLSLFWRKRLQDSKIDNCVGIVTASTPKNKGVKA